MAIASISDQFTKVILGSNTFLNARAFIRIDGEEQMHLERGSIDDQLLLTTDVYTSGGKHVAKLRRNAWAFHDDEYEVTTTPTNLSLVEAQSGRELFVARVTDLNTIAIDTADFYGVNGSHLVATPEAVLVNDTITLAGNTMAGTNGIAIGPMGFAM